MGAKPGVLRLQNGPRLLPRRSEGRFVATWRTPPRGRYILLFAKTENGGVKGADPWGAATVSVDGSQAVPLLYMASQKIAVIDLGRMWRIKKIAILVRGEGHPGLAGIEIHESAPGRSRRGPVSSRRRLAAAPLPRRRNPLAAAAPRRTLGNACLHNGPGSATLAKGDRRGNVSFDAKGETIASRPSSGS